jgi:hypothetical protein
VVQDFLVDPPHDVDERLFRVAAVRIGAVADRVEGRVVAAEQGLAPGRDAVSKAATAAATSPLMR